MNNKFLLQLILMVLGSNVFADSFLYEVEPNNEPLIATKFQPPIKLIGQLPKEDQDLYVWDVNDAQSGILWDFELNGMPDALTQVDIMKLTFTDDGTGVTKVDKIYTLQTYNNKRPFIAKNLLLPEGKYYLGFSFARKNNASVGLFSNDALEGLSADTIKDIKKNTNQNQILDKLQAAQTYRINIKKGESIYYSNALGSISKDKANGFSHLRSALIYQEKPIWTKFSITEKQSNKKWKISGEVSLGNKVVAKLYNSDGEVLSQTASSTNGYYQFTDLSLPVGQYNIEFSSSMSFFTITIYQLEIGEVLSGEEKEPNDYIKLANKIKMEEMISGKINTQNNYDYFNFSVDETTSSKDLVIELNNPDKKELSLCLLNKSGRSLLCKKGNDTVQLKDLNLSVANFGLLVSGDENANYSLKIIIKGKHKSIMEAEPNNYIKNAVSMNAKNIIRGNFDGDDSDFFKFDISQDLQNWVIQTNGKGINSLLLYNATGRKIASTSSIHSKKRMKLSNLNLSPGRYTVGVSGNDGKYLMRVFSTGKIDPDFEKEPNDSKAHAMPIIFGQTKRGMLDKADDSDIYRFKLDSQEHIKITITPSSDGDFYYYLMYGGEQIATMAAEKGEVLTIDSKFPMGEYYLDIRANYFPSDSAYKIKLERLPQSVCLNDCEPNNFLKTAQQIPENWKIKGTVGTQGDYDWYYIEPFQKDTQLSFVKVTGDDASLIAIKENRYNYALKNNYEKNYKYATFKANEKIYLKISGRMADYEFDVLVNGEKSQAKLQNGNLKGIDIVFKEIPETIRAFYDYAQVINATLEIKNNSDKTKKLSLFPKASHHAWKVEVDKNQLELAPGESATLPLTINIPSDVHTKTNYNIDLIVKDENNNSTQASTIIGGDFSIVAINPELYWSIDKRLLGGINVGSFAMGSQRTKQDVNTNTAKVGEGFDKIFDGTATINDGLKLSRYRKNLEDTITIDLAGDFEQEIIGMIINPYETNSPNFYPKNIDIGLSTDGINFTTVLKTQLSRLGAEQSLVFEKSIKAKYARLRIIDSYNKSEKSKVVLGEWKVIAKADNQLSPNGFNIADPKHGGFVVWSLPEFSGSWDKELLTQEQENISVSSKNSDDWQWVIGFNHQRSALIDQIQWFSPEVSDKTLSFDKVQIMASLDGPSGPWKMITKVQIDNSQTQTDIVFEKPIWARYLKFNVGSVPNYENRQPPKTIKVIEHLIGENHQSILGQWGQDTKQSYYEMITPKNFISTLDDKNLNNHSKENAHELKNKSQFTGQVQLEHTDKLDWFKITISDGQNTLNVSLKGEPNLSTMLECFDDENNSVPFTKTSQQSNLINYAIKVEAGQTYYLKISEPPRSVIFTWDTSTSTYIFQPIIYQALKYYTQAIIPRLDLVNFQPFGRGLLSNVWSSSSLVMQIILNEYLQKESSSSAEKAIYDATNSLENRQGSKTIVIITDAESPKYVDMWETVNKVKPRIFSLTLLGNLGYSVENTNLQEDLMQSWAMVNHGDYRSVNSLSDMEVAFDRVEAKLRQPAIYGLSIATNFEKEKGPGTLKITQNSNQINNSDAIELILDASGSMLKRLNGKRRINIAKEVLSKAVTEIIPKGTPVALRVFGNKQAGSCRTDLAMPLKPLNPQKAKAIITAINAKNLAKTPIAASLAKIATDLRANKGKKIIILVTDGEETCEGDPKKVIESLKEKGIDLRLNIVGFAIDDEKLKQQFQSWSSVGGGKYFDSNNSDSLKKSIIQALQTPFSVYSLTGELIAEGTVNGESIELPAGFYKIKVFSSQIKTYEKYHIKGEQEQYINL